MKTQYTSLRFISRSVKELLILPLLIVYLWQPLHSAAANEATGQRQTLSPDIPEGQFGRLFTTPRERALLDAQRQQHGFSEPLITSVEVASTSDIAPVDTQQSIKLSGILLRADGQQQIWINGKLQPQQKKINIKQNTKAVMPTSATLKVPIQKQNQHTTLKPGQVWVLGSRKTTESYLLPESRPKKIDVPVEVKKPAKVEKPIDEVSTPVEKTETTTEPAKVSK